MKKTLSCLLAFVMAVVAMQAASPSGTLPVLHINTENGATIDSKEEYLSATYWLDPMGTDFTAFGSEAAPLDLQIRGRGNYTWTGFEKKPYRLKLGKKQKLMGMNSSKHWALLAHADDNRGFLRNAVGFQLSRLIGLPWTPGDQPVEVVLNDDYIGLYFLTETVRVDEKRVNVYDYDSAVEDAEDDLSDAKDALAAATDENRAELEQAVADAQAALTEARNAEPAWLVEIDNYDDPEQVKVKEEGYPGALDPNDEYIRFTYDSPSDYITEQHRQWLINEMTEVNRLIYDSDKSNCRWAEKVDLTDLAKFFVVNQIMFNYESFHGSCKLYRDNAAHAAEMGTDTKWHFSPVWDFGSAFQNKNTQRWLYEEEYHSVWIEEMMKYPAFKSEVDRVYAEFMDSNFNEIYDYIDTFTDKIQAAARPDAERWSYKGYGNPNPKENANDVKNQLNNSINYLKSALNYNGSGDDDDVEAPDTDIYLRGEINGWKAPSNYQFTDKGNGIYTLDVASLTGTWKLAGPDEEWNNGNVDFGAQSGQAGIELDTPVTLTFGGANCSLSDQTLTNLTLTFNWNTKELTVTAQGEGGGDDDDDPTPVYPELYLRGEFAGSSWAATDTYKFTREDNIYTLSVASINGKFKIADDSWTSMYNFGAPEDNAVISINTPTVLCRGVDYNCKTDGTYTNVLFTFDYSTLTLTITEKGGDDDNFVVYYHDKSNNPWETVCVYMWKDGVKPCGEWPGAEMTLVQPANRVMSRVSVADGEKLWKYEHNAPLADGHSIIFNNNDNGSQTENLTVNGNNHVYASDKGNNSEPFSGITTGIATTEADADMQITASNGTLKVVSATDCVLVVTRIDGVNFTLEVVAGENTYTLPRGFYIAAGRKFAL